MAELHVYNVVIDGNHTSVQLTDQEAERIGVKKRTAANKARTSAPTKAETVEVDEHICDVCGKQTKTAGGLSSHRRSHDD